MQRVSSPGHVNNRFVEEDVNINRPPTQLPASWFNDVQEEIVSVISAAGITLNGAQQNQLLQALNQLYGTAAASETASGRVELATSAEAVAGTDNTRAVHPLGLKSALNYKANLNNPVFTDRIRVQGFAGDDNKGTVYFGQLDRYIHFDGNTFYFNAPTGGGQLNGQWIATHNYVFDQIESFKNFITNGASTAMDQLNELATALNNDPNFATNVINLISQKVSITSFNDWLTGFLANPYRSTTLSVDDISGKLVSSAWAKAGFYFYPGANGAFVMPGFLGGFVFQWGWRLNDLTGGNSSFYTPFNIPFPNQCFGGIAVDVGLGCVPYGFSPASANGGYIHAPAYFNSQSNNTNISRGNTSAFWLAVGN